MRRAKGITMVSLVVTIIVLVILAGVSITALMGENGIITIAKKAKENTELAQEAEMKLLNELYLAMQEEGITEGVSYDAILKLKEFKRKIAQAITNSGIETKETETADTMASNIEQLGTSSSSVYYVTLKDGNKLPVPKGFYYVGGTLDNGAIISDNIKDKYEEGIDKTTYEYTTTLVGNQFVWIPCSTEEYKKCNVWNGITQTNTELGKVYFSNDTSKSELIQIEKYGGFYVARYEAGLAETIEEFKTNQQHTAVNNIYNLEGKPQSKADCIPWMFIDRKHAKENSEAMYKNEYISSGLITGTQWDVILNKMLSKGALKESDLTNSIGIGNYMDSILTYTGRIAKVDYGKTISGSWVIKPFGNKTSGQIKNDYNEGEVFTTGASAQTELYHIFDMAGNLWEWTDEVSTYQNAEDITIQYSCRGGYAADTGTNICYRSAYSNEKTMHSLGFRVVLYIK